MMRLTPALRRKLKKPLGRICKKAVKRGKIIAVGDIASYELIQMGITPNLMVYDYRVKRRPVSKEVKRALDAVGYTTYKIKNPRSTLQDEAWVAMAEGLRKNSKIIVSGEEDLLTLPAVLLAKNGSRVFYGQPGKGMVLIEVNAKTKKKVKKLVDEMEVKL